MRHFLDPFEELRRMHDRLNRMFEEFERFSRQFAPEELAVPAAMPVDVIDEGDKIKVVADLPGFNKEDIQIYVEDGDLVIRAERKEEKEERGKDFIRQERRYGEVYRRVSLPAEVKIEEAKASYNNGVLEIVLPKTEKAQKKEIKIE
ncbi:archaeal heat shock protein Hsp14 [Archaeoglobus veneficus]|uniref:Heat shock protein Hsp20 n=1 Tax=Archaeoglobus veneficus (strain DSM 11195 / SNP6) TaxID=693661 RepID=F2KNM3_ARCVS|nr:archaeal heat shock protein Hsp14 [Archaeoglobus veneficus]AEA46251.1 heat shock protein Hsp20 [Archaeoglobus veneficus SNP6]